MEYLICPKNFKICPDLSLKQVYYGVPQQLDSLFTIGYTLDFTSLQENMFIAIIGKTDIDLVALEKGELDEGAAGKWLNTTFDFFNQNKVEIINKNVEDIKNRINRPYLEEDKMLELTAKMTKSQEKIAIDRRENIFVAQAPKGEESLKNTFPKIRIRNYKKEAVSKVILGQLLFYATF